MADAQIQALAAEVQELAKMLKDNAKKGHVSTKKVEAFKSGDPDEWLSWRSHFELVAKINGWDDDRSKQELAASVLGVAKARVRHIAVDDGGYGTIRTLLNNYEKCFVPTTATDLAKAEFRNSKQAAEETLLAWHSRLRSIFKRAYPAMDAADVEKDDRLMSQFETGLYDSAMLDKMGGFIVKDYSASLEAASHIAGRRIVMDEHRKLHQSTNVPTGKSSASISAVQQPHSATSQPNSAVLRCFICNKPGHMQRHCRLVTGNSRGRGRGRGSGRGGRGRGGSRGGSASSTNRSVQQYRIQQIEALLKEAREGLQAESAPTDPSTNQGNF